MRPAGRHAWLALVAAWALWAWPAPPTPGPVAVVAALSGSAARGDRGLSPAAGLRLFDRLCVGDSAETAAGASLVLAWADGRRFALGPRTRIEVGPSGPTLRSGDVRELQGLPSVPPLAPPADGSVGRRIAAIRLRDDGIAGFYPREPWTALAEAASLRFAPAPQVVDGYELSVRDEDGRVVYATHTSGSAVALPPRTLTPGRSYAWTVRARDTQGFSIAGEARFTTVAAALGERRAELQQAAAEGADPAPLALLAQVDWDLGLLDEAQAELRQAAQRAEGAALREALLELEQQLRERALALQATDTTASAALPK